MKTTYKLFGILPTLLFLTAFAAAVAIKLGYWGNPFFILFGYASFTILAFCAADVLSYTNRTVILTNPNFSTDDLKYKSKHELKRLEQHAHMIGASDQAAVIADYAATRALSGED